MTQHVLDCSRKPKSQMGAKTLTSPPVMIKYKTKASFPLLHRCSVIVSSERPFLKNCITQKSVHWFPNQLTGLCMTQAHTEIYFWTHFSMERIETLPKQLNLQKPFFILIIQKAILNLALKVIKNTEKILQTKALQSVWKGLFSIKSLYQINQFITLQSNSSVGWFEDDMSPYWEAPGNRQ